MDLKKLNDALNTHIRPQTYPLAVKLCKTETELPAKARRPLRDFGYTVALCQSMGLARRFRWTIAVGDEDQCCSGGSATMGFPLEGAEGGFMPPQVNKQLEKGRFSYFLVSPVETADFEPDMIIVYCDPAQANRLTVGAMMGTGKEVPATAPGFVECGDTVAKTYITDSCRFILADGGDRNFGGTQDNEVIFTIPSSQVEALLKGLEDSHKMGFRYPILTDLRHRPVLASFLEKPKES
jgi:uncharacterized protein (DUF169 family)